VVEVVSGLPGVSAADVRPQVDTVVGLLVAYGDLLELPLDDLGGKRTHIFLGPPTFVRRSAGCLLLGVRPDGAPILDGIQSHAIEYRGHVRVLRSQQQAVHELLVHEGLAELQVDHWLRAPRKSSPRELVDAYVKRLAAAVGTAEIQGLRVLDPTTRVTYYRGRWRDLRPPDTGRFIARRPQAFGSDLWCFSEVSRGHVSRLIDLPISSPLKSGADEAWRLQAALDAIAGSPQRVRISCPQAASSHTLLDLYSPVPSWCQRRLDAVATPVTRSPSALVSYQVSHADIDEEIEFLKDMMWIAVEETSQEDGN
jgi:hypothetical protein